MIVDVQGAGVVVIGHVQPGEVHPLGQDGGKKALPLVPRQGGEGLKGPAALAGHLAPDPHIRATVVVDGDGVEVQPVLVSPGPLGLLPGQRAQSQKLRHLVGVLPIHRVGKLILMKAASCSTITCLYCGFAILQPASKSVK